MTIQEIIKKFTEDNKEMLFTEDNQLTKIGVLAYTIIGIEITTKFCQEYIKLKKENKIK